MKVITLLLPATFIMTIVLSAPAQARLEPDNHTGFYIGLGIGGGSVSVKVDDFESDSETSGAAQLRLGAAISQTVLIGVESNGWVKEYDVFGDTWTLTLNNVAATITFYPTHYFFIKGGPAIGVAGYEIDPAGGGGKFSDNASGGGFMIGAGGELRLTEKFALVPSAQWMWQRITTDIGFGEGDFDFSFFSITLGVGWFW